MQSSILPEDETLQRFFTTKYDNGESVCRAIIEGRCLIIDKDNIIHITSKSFEKESLVVKMAIDFLGREFGYDVSGEDE